MNRSIVLLVGFVLAFVAFVMFWFENGNAIKYKAYNDCASISKYEVKQGNATITYPIADLYQKCLDRIK
jgi:hypothetical protein